ncbi:YHYH protein [Chromobacterium paludis]|uniref:YHYH protein n=2 Tax=Chromobacterium paludis TaxID=2605945 RepID=A0A5C1DDD1_9NEIS|nr:YHYH protein [Chromobacterium paludis]
MPRFLRSSMTLAVAAILCVSCGGGGGSSSSSSTASSASGSSGSTSQTGNYSTAGVLCSYSESTFNSSPSVNATSTAVWSCTSSARQLSANGLPDHAVGTFPNVNNPNTISAQSVTPSFALSPSLSGSSKTVQPTGYALNGVKFDPATAGSCDNSGSCTLVGNTGSWSIEALGQSSFNFGVDSNNAHVQPNGAYHYHGMPNGLIAELGKGTAMTLVGWAEDGFPIYARYGYSSANDAASAIKTLSGSYQLKSTPDSGRPSTSLYPMGTFSQDYQYVAGSGDLDECNGRTGVTPEFPGGIYYYVITDSYPYISRCVKGS